MMKLSVMLFLLVLMINSNATMACQSKRSRTEQNENRAMEKKPATQASPSEETDQVMRGEMKTLAEGGYSNVTDALLVVAREAETYAALRELINQLPALPADFFNSQAVVAAFLGQRRTGGYSVEITQDAEGIVHVASKSPPADAMTTQAITAPFKIVSVTVRQSALLRITPGDAWQNATRPYKVKSGEFQMSGGIAGRSEAFKLEGDLRIMRYGKFATITFDLKSIGGTKQRIMQTIASGLVNGNQLRIGYLFAGSLINSPHPPLSAEGVFSAHEDDLSLKMKTLRPTIADGFIGSGTLEASATAPPPQKRKSVIIE